MADINFQKIEKKWREKWEKAKAFEVKEDPKKEKYYVLEQFPYPSGSGLHMGHAFIYTIGDIFARTKRMQGFNVLYPMGFDSFGLPAENAAIKAKSHPKKFTEDAIKSFIEHFKRFGNSYDWSRVIETHKPEFYKWDQWIFLKMLEKGLAYRRKAPVNWCPKCNTVLANEQVHSGMCWRHEDTPVEVKHLEQWFLKITDYADELLEGLENEASEWPELIKTLQRNWIGKSYGTEAMFEINGENWPVFTTRVDTIFGVTFTVISAQHPRLMEIVTKEQKKEVEAFLKKVNSVSEKSQEELDKEGVFTGSYAINPMTGEKVPVWAGNFVLADYGSGMVMAVPAHDQRDFEFAKKYGIPLKVVIKPRMFDLNADKMSRAFTDDGTLVNSGEFDGYPNRDAIEDISEALAKKKLGKKTVNYKLRDWLISRQRFWGTPIPIVYCDDCGAVPVPEKDLPVELPEDIKFTDTKNPLVDYKPFVETKCPKCGGAGRRETDTMDTFVNSSWYFLRYCDPENSKKIVNEKKAEYWMPIDMYIGGKEHACMHDIYFRFYTKFLRDIGLLKINEPAKRLFNQGFVYGSDGRKMSKSYGNSVIPGEAADKFGVDAVRLFLVSVASPDKDFNWDDRGVESAMKFLKRVMEKVDSIKIGKSSAKQSHKVNRAIKEITENVEAFKYNFATIRIREVFDSLEGEISKEDLQSITRLISPFCPFVAEEIWEKVGGKGFVSLAEWPVADEKKINPEFEKAEQVTDKTVSDILNIIRLLKEKQDTEIEKVYIYAIPPEIPHFDTGEISRRVGKSVAVFAVNDPKKYDPEGKASKAKPGKPAIFAE